MTALRWLPLFLSLVPAVSPAVEPETVDVFVPSRDGFRSIRIPSVVVTKRGTVLAFAEGRAAARDQAQNKLVLKRSLDGGKSFGPLAVIADDGDRSLNNPCVVVDRQSGAVWMLYQSYPAGVAERSVELQAGLEGDRIVRNYLLRSDDDGVTWSRPRDVTRATKRPEKVTTLASGPGLGIQLRHGPHAGRLLFPINEGPYGLWNLYVVYSDDRGQSWSIGEVVPGGIVDDSKKGRTSSVNESQIVELADGSVRINARQWAGQAVRKTAVSADGGVTWSRVEDAPELLDPSCMASIFRYSDPIDGPPSRILYSGPQSTRRENGTVFLSTDEGRTWPIHRVLQPGRFAYSCLTALPDGTIGCLYEADGMNRVVFARFPLDWLQAGEGPPR